MKNEWKGYMGVLVASLAMSNVYIFSKAALNELSLAQFGMLWFGFSLFWNMGYLWLTGRYKKVMIVTKPQLKILFQLGIIEIIGTTGFFTAIKLLPNPTTVSFLGNIGPIYVTLLGYWFLKERLTRFEIIGGLLTLTGAFVISYRPNWDLPHDFIIGLIVIATYTLVYAVGKIISKKHIKEIHPETYTLSRSVYLFLFATLFFIFNGEAFNFSQSAVTHALAGALLGPFLASLADYYAIQYIDASKASILGSFKGFLVLITSYLYFGLWPYWYQILGGTLTVLGVILITTSKQIKAFKKKHLSPLKI